MANPTGKNTPFVKGNKLAVGNKGGRPEKYTQEWLEEEAKVLLEWMKLPDNYYFKTFAYERGYRPDDFDDFCRKSKEFSIAYRNCKDIQEQKFIHNGLTRQWDPGFTSKVMSRVCGSMWRNSWDREEEKTDIPTQIIQHIVSYSDIQKESDGKVQ